MGRSQESFNKKEVRNKKEKKRKEKEAKRLAKKEGDKKSSLDDMIAYVDANGQIIDSPPPEPSKQDEIKLEDIQISVPKGSAVPDDPVKKGVVSFFNHAKGFGFIKNLDNKQDIFVHVNNCLDEIREGNQVNYEIGMGPKGQTAINVKIDK